MLEILVLWKFSRINSMKYIVHLEIQPDQPDNCSLSLYFEAYYVDTKGRSADALTCKSPEMLAECLVPAPLDRNSCLSIDLCTYKARRDSIRTFLVPPLCDQPQPI